MEQAAAISLGGYEMPIKIHTPDFGAPTRCIIGVHGFCGHKDSLVLRSLAEEMGLFGAAAVCFDFPAHGESPLTDRELTLPGCAEALTGAARWAADRFPGIPKCVFATGFGAYVTVLCLDQLRQVLGEFRLVMQTPDFRMSDSLLHMKNISAEDLQKMGRVTVGRVGDRKIEVSYRFYEELRSAVTYADYETPMLLIHGEFDEVVPLEDVLRFRRINELSSLVIVPGADHQFRGEGQWDMVVDLTRDWFEFQQVTLCDCI